MSLVAEVIAVKLELARAAEKFAVQVGSAAATPIIIVEGRDGERKLKGGGWN